MIRNAHIHLSMLVAAIVSTQVFSAQTCNPKVRPTTPTWRFVIDVNKGTVLDTKTGLMWRRCAEGSSGTDCAYRARSFKWDEALLIAADSTWAGYKDWRVPSLKELQSLVEYQCWAPAINSTVFPGTPELGVEEGPGTWTSTPNAFNVTKAWSIDFSDGRSSVVKDRYNSHGAVRLVRGGQ